MNFDLRIPVGLMFFVFGLILTSVGLFGDAANVTKTLGLNVNLWWGLFQAFFGAGLLLLAYRGRNNAS